MTIMFQIHQNPWLSHKIQLQFIHAYLVSLKSQIVKVSKTNTCVLPTWFTTEHHLFCIANYFIGTLRISFPEYRSNFLLYLQALPVLFLFLGAVPHFTTWQIPPKFISSMSFFPDLPCVLSSLVPTSHYKQSVVPSSAPLAPCIDLIITLQCNCWLLPLQNGEDLGVFSPQVYHPTLAHSKCSINFSRKRESGRERRR